MSRQISNTIYALSSAPGRAAISVLRLSGPESLAVLQKLRFPTNEVSTSRPLESHKARLANLYNHKQQLLDKALCLWFAGPKSYTGDDLVELHLHGSPAVVQAVMDAIKYTEMARYAEPGEFTKRAFHNGKLDLTQVEAIRDLIDADTELQRQAAVLGADGQNSIKFATWRKQILQNAGMLTALIDFSDDNEIDTTPEGLISQVRAAVETIKQQVAEFRTQAKCSELIQSGVRLALLGPPNAGKSSLVNALVNRTASIVSDVPGTTRDVVHVSLDIQGFKVVLGDTAGIRKVTGTTGHDRIEALGIERALEVAKDAHIVAVVVPFGEELSSDLVETVQMLKQSGKVVITVGNKADLGSVQNVDVELSCKTGEGLGELVSALGKACQGLTIKDSDNIVGASQRVIDLIDSAVLPGLEQSANMLALGDVTLANAELHLAADGIGKITGQGITANEILGVVFGNFCIGK